MPVPAKETVSASLQDVIQGRLQGSETFEQIESYLASLKAKNGGSVNCGPSVITDMKTILQQEAKTQNFGNIKTLLRCIQHIATKPIKDFELPVLLENGLLDLLGHTYNTVFMETCPSNRNFSPPSSCDACFVQLLETINDVADHSSSTKEHVSQAFAEKLMAFVVRSPRNFCARMEAIRTLNLLLEGCSSQCLSNLRSTEAENLLKEFAEFLPKAGDFEMQVACTETLARFIKKSEREQFSEKCFSNKAVAASFLNIRDACFEVDCRKFLNKVNESQSDGRGVFSLPCEKAFLGQYKLKCPQDDNTIDFWVDFNSVSRSITIYVAEENAASENTGMWETVTLQEDQVRQVDIKKFGDLQHLHVHLTVPVSQIVPFCKNNSQTALIIFHPHHDLHLPLASCFSPEKILSQNKVRRKSSECTVKVLFSRIGEEGSIHTKNFYGKGRAEDKASCKKESPKSNSCAVPVRTKISAPLNLMTSPPRQSGKNQSNTSSHAKKRYADSTPKRPQQQPPKRVKTPLNVSVSDKTPITGGNNEDAQRTGTSEEKESATSTEKSDGEAEGKATATEVKRSKSDGGRVSSSRQDKSSSDGVSGTDEERQIPSIPQIVPESQYSQTVVEETQEENFLDSHQGSESLPESCQSAPQVTKNDGRKKRQQSRRRRSAGDPSRKRRSPRIEALKQMSALNPRKEKHSKSGKFRLYSEGKGLVGDGVTPDGIIPSSCPSQDSMADFVPDACPLTRKPMEEKDKDKGRKSSSSPGLSYIPEKSTESSETSEMDNKKTSRAKPKRRRRCTKAQIKAKSTRKGQKSKKPMYNKIEDETSSVSSTLHQTREFLSQSLPVLPPSDIYNEDDDPYIFTDINENSQKLKKSARKEKRKEKDVKVTKIKKNLNKPDKFSFLHKKSYMSFPTKSLTLPLVGSEQGIKKASNGSVMGGEIGKSLGTGDGLVTDDECGTVTKEQEEDKNVQRTKKNRRGRAQRKEERQPSVNNGKKGKQREKGQEGSRECNDELRESEVVSSNNEKLNGQIEEKKMPTDGDEELNVEMEGPPEGKKRGRNSREEMKGRKFVGKGKILKDADVSFAAREMQEISDVEVMRDAVHLENDFQDDELHGLIQSMKKFLGKPVKVVTEKQFQEESTLRKEERMKMKGDVQKNEDKESGGEKEVNDRVTEMQIETAGGSSEEGQDTDGNDRQRGKRKMEKESESDTSFSDDGNTMEEINKELRALSKELQETGRRKKKQTQQGVGERYEDNLIDESTKKSKKETVKTPGRTSRYGSDIEDEDEVASDISLDFDDKKTEASVQSFSKICKSIVCQSGGGIAKSRSKRNLPKVDYRDQDVSVSEEEYNPPKDVEPIIVSSDSQVEKDEEGYTSNISKRTSDFTDAQSERSWLVEKSHIKVSTYSKFQRRRWTKERGREDVVKTVKKTSQQKKTENKKRSASPENVELELLAPKKKKKKNSTEDGGAIEFLYYQQNSQQLHPGSQEQLIQKVSSRVAQEDPGVTPSSSHHSKSSGKSRIREFSSWQDDVVDDSQEVMIKSQTTLSTPGWHTLPQDKTGEEEEIQSDGDDPDAKAILLSGPSKVSNLTQSFLKRKYEHMVEDITRPDDEDSPEEEEEEEDEMEMDATLKPPMVRRSINPRRLFENELFPQTSTALHGDDKPIEADGENGSVTASSSSSNLTWKHGPGDFYIPEMMAIVGQKIQRQFAEKRNQTLLMTDSVLKSMQKYLSKIWAEQNHTRQTALEEFRESLLKEIVALEVDIENLNKTSSKLQALAHSRLKTGVEMSSKHAMHIRSLHRSYIQELNEVDQYLEANLKKSVKTIVEQELSSLKNKLLNDVHAQDVSQMKRALHSYLSL